MTEICDLIRRRFLFGNWGYSKIKRLVNYICVIISCYEDLTPKN